MCVKTASLDVTCPGMCVYVCVFPVSFDPLRSPLEVEYTQKNIDCTWKLEAYEVATENPILNHRKKS